MRLINTTTLKIHEFIGDKDIPRYAILSHRWETEECKFQDMEKEECTLQETVAPDVTSRRGYWKILQCCTLALEDGWDWVWVDTCCIDKTSTAELSEAINSMFRWYKHAEVCYAYLFDVESNADIYSETSSFSKSEWFTRGWTLQELIAPSTVLFYSSDWQALGSKGDLKKPVSRITGIDEEVLDSAHYLSRISTAKKMSWAARRETTRTEDRAYCLLGIFDINMPLLYGEGTNAFRRLQEEILNISNDQTLFAWGLPEGEMTKLIWHPSSQRDGPFAKRSESWLEHCSNDGISRRWGITSFSFDRKLYGLLADSPADFIWSGGVKEVPSQQTPNIPPIISNNGIRIELPVIGEKVKPYERPIAVITCTISGYFDYYLALQIVERGPNSHSRCRQPVLVSFRYDDELRKQREQNLVQLLPTTNLSRTRERTSWMGLPRDLEQFPLEVLQMTPSNLPDKGRRSIIKFGILLSDETSNYRIGTILCSSHASFRPAGSFSFSVSSGPNNLTEFNFHKAPEGCLEFEIISTAAAPYAAVILIATNNKSGSKKVPDLVAFLSGNVVLRYMQPLLAIIRQDESNNLQDTIANAYPDLKTFTLSQLKTYVSVAADTAILPSDYYGHFKMRFIWPMEGFDVFDHQKRCFLVRQGATTVDRCMDSLRRKMAAVGRSQIRFEASVMLESANLIDDMAFLLLSVSKLPVDSY